jgi:uncharacterized protein YllA (UPF0747 family)
VNDPGCHRVALDRYPGMTRFVLDWLAGDERFLPRVAPPPPAARSLDSSFIDALIVSNRRWGIDVADDLRRWAAGGTQTIVAGQQAGFAGGPLFTFTKIASLLKMKRDNEARGISTTIFFWLATEDHDFAEVATLAIPNHDEHRQRDLVYLKATNGDSRAVVGRLPIPESLIEDLVSTMQIPRPKWLRPGITFADSFGELIATAFGSGFILVDSLLPELRRAGGPLFDAIVSRWNDIQSSVAKRSAELERAGYTPQIKPPRAEQSYTLLYNINPNGERELIQAPSRVASPESISTSALTRPLLQAFVLRPDIFVGGPAEVAYYAQVAPLHDLLKLRMPKVALRAHILVAPRKVVRYFSRFGIPPEAVFENPDEIAASLAEHGVADIRRIASEAESALKPEIEKIRDLAMPADHAVARSVNRSIGHIEYHFKKLTERAIRGLVRKDRDRFHAARELASTFYPDHHVQDRVVAWLPWWCEYREQLVERVVSEAESDVATFKIVSL